MKKQCFLTEKGPKAVGPDSTAVVYGDTIYLSGMVPIDPATQKPIEGDCVAQAKQVFANIKTVLDEMGADMKNVIKSTVYLTNIGDFAAVNAEYKEWFGPDYPARTCVEVSKLPLGVSIEVEVIVAR